ncbi:MAG: serine/threonine-protein kinase, partial [Planctomycetota bacterium]
MTNHVEDCPQVTTLQDFLSGKLDEPVIRDIESHLSACSPCGDTVRSLKVDDTLFQLARKANKQHDSSAENLIVDDLIARYRDLPTEAGSEHSAANDSPEDILQSRVNEVTTRLAPAQSDDEIGRLAHYRLLRILGVGGMGVVYLAEDTQLERMVALKILRPSLGQAARQRFLLEARAAAGVEHDHVVTIYQVGEENQLAFLAMQWLDGETLEDRLEREAKLPIAEVARIGRELALGLAAAHNQSVVHRDIKPANVWLEADRGRTRILDFGLARAVNENPQLTETGMIAGTPAYMSPEQARGEVVDQRSDLFSLGCVLYRMVTGQLPFNAANPLATIMAIQSHHPADPRD